MALSAADIVSPSLGVGSYMKQARGNTSSYCCGSHGSLHTALHSHAVVIHPHPAVCAHARTPSLQLLSVHYRPVLVKGRTLQMYSRCTAGLARPRRQMTAGLISQSTSSFFPGTALWWVCVYFFFFFHSGKFRTSLSPTGKMIRKS